MGVAMGGGASSPPPVPLPLASQASKLSRLASKTRRACGPGQSDQGVQMVKHEYNGLEDTLRAGQDTSRQVKVKTHEVSADTCGKGQSKACQLVNI
jgi:hypothetical protein